MRAWPVVVQTSHLEDAEPSFTHITSPPSTALQLPHSGREGGDNVELQTPRGKGARFLPAPTSFQELLDLRRGERQACHLQTRAAGCYPHGLPSLAGGC